MFRTKIWADNFGTAKIFQKGEFCYIFCVVAKWAHFWIANYVDLIFWDAYFHRYHLRMLVTILYASQDLIFKERSKTPNNI